MPCLLRAMVLLLFVLSKPLFAQVTLMCNGDNFLFQPIDLTGVTSGVEVSAKKSEVIDKNLYKLIGDAVLQSPDYYLNAQQIDYLKNEKQTTATGDVHFQDNTLLIQADQLEMAEGEIDISNAHYQFLTTPAQGTAQQVNLTNQKIVTLHNAHYSTCPINDSIWKMKASKVVLDKNTSYGTADHVVLTLKDVPVLYLPTITWVLEGRKTGVLIPSFNSYSNSSADEEGTQIKVPYYVNIASDKDLLLTLNYLSTRGESIEAKYRELFHRGYMELEGGYLDEDEMTNEKRWFINSEFRYDINDNLNIDINTKQVSDESYLNEIAHQNRTLNSLESSGVVRYQQNDFDLSLLAQTQQAVNGADPTYYRLPEIKAKQSLSLNDGADMLLAVDATKFRHEDDTLVNGNRVHSSLAYQHSIKGIGYGISPIVSAQSTQYHLQTETETDLVKSRDIYRAELDSYVLLEKRFNNGILHTIKPRAYYVYTNKTEQLDLPVFDTSVKSFSYNALFSPSQFSGIDRINRANDVALGIESDLIDLESGENLVDIRIGQRFYQHERINSTASTLTDADAENTVDSRKYSDIAADLKIYLNQYQLVNQLRWDPEENDIVKRTTALDYHKEKNYFFTLAHHEIDDENILEGSFSVPISANSYIISSLNKSLTHNRLKKSSLGFIYESCCWAFKAVYFEEYSGDDNGDDEFDRVTKLEFVFKGLGSTTPDINNMIKSYIPDYINE